MARGYKQWTTGELVETADINDKFVSQGVIYFASASARDTAITAPVEGMHAYLADIGRVTYYDGALWVDRQVAEAHSVTVEKAGTVVGTRRRINLIEGTNITLTVVDDAGGDEIDVTVASSVSSVDRAVVTGFVSEDATDLGTATQLGRSVVGAVPVVMDRAGSVVGVSVALAAARTAGSLVFEVFINGTGTGLTVTIDATNTQYHYASQAAALDTFSAGDRLDIRGTNTSFTPTTAAVEASFTVQYD